MAPFSLFDCRPAELGVTLMRFYVLDMPARNIGTPISLLHEHEREYEEEMELMSPHLYFFFESAPLLACPTHPMILSAHPSSNSDIKPDLSSPLTNTNSAPRPPLRSPRSHKSPFPRPHPHEHRRRIFQPFIYIPHDRAPSLQPLVARVHRRQR